MAKPKLRIIPLGGLGEIGKNMTVFEYGNEAIIIDTGIMFPANDMHGVDYIIPDFRYLIERTDLKIHAILFTHGHEDHIGAVSHVVSELSGIPIYATPLTAGLIEVKLRERKLMDATKINIFKAGEKLTFGPFKIESFHMTHSIPDCVGFAIDTPQGLIVHTGDYKFDNTPVDGRRPDYARLASYGQRGVLLLMADSTNADKKGWTPSEAVIDDAFDKAFKEAKGRIMVATFASLISRVAQVAKAAKFHNRRMAIAGTTMIEYVKMSRKLGYLNDLTDKMMLDIGKVNSIEPHRVVMMVTGSQGEPSAVLNRLATGRNRSFDIRDGDTIILSSHPIPGNEEMVYRTINRLIQRGANVIDDHVLPVHVSGHCNQEEMRMMMNLVQPKFMMPIHGELRHLHMHAKLAVDNGIPHERVILAENGHVVEVDKHHVRITDRVPGGYVFVDGSSVGDIGRAVIRDREILARDGFLIVVVTVNKKTGALVGDPEIISRGFVYLRDAEDLIYQIKSTVHDTMLNLRGQNGRRRDKLEESVGRMIYNETKRRPMLFTVVNEV